MTAHFGKTLIIALALAVLAASPVDAKARKHHKHMAGAPAAKATANCRGGNLYPCGPIIWNDIYFGTDPDPFIRAQLWRDFNAKFGGGEN
ncbi:MAG TPA: hypothetical protein VFB45_20015 [Pseudolabrys sp.]|nr:hypothetical protein [Pseudolabrys sp.]